jgi:hypothetical protein
MNYVSYNYIASLKREPTLLIEFDDNITSQQSSSLSNDNINVFYCINVSTVDLHAIALKKHQPAADRYEPLIQIFGYKRVKKFLYFSLVVSSLQSVPLVTVQFRFDRCGLRNFLEDRIYTLRLILSSSCSIVLNTLRDIFSNHISVSSFYVYLML